MDMQFAMWAYPWDLIDEGVDAAIERLSTIGIDEVNLATNYHALQGFHPHNPERRTFFANASSYFHPDDCYGLLEPIPNETMGSDDWLETIDDAFAASDLSLNSWTIGCHNSRLGMRHPDVTIESPYGDDLVFGLCPSHPDVRDYLEALVTDLTGRASFTRIELETFDYFHGTGFGWHHEKFHTRLGNLGEFLFGLCFCEHCRVNATDAGVDAETARQDCVETLDALAEGRLPHDIDIATWFDVHPEVVRYVDVRTNTLAEVFADLEVASNQVDLGYYVGLLSVDQTWMHGADLDKLAEFVDYYTVAAYESTRTDAEDTMRTASHITPEIPLHAGILPGHPAIHDRQTVEDSVEGVISEGAERVSFYNYGLLPERNLDWVRSATAPYR